MEDFLQQGYWKRWLSHTWWWDGWIMRGHEHHVLRSNPDDFILVLSPDLFESISIILRLISYPRVLKKMYCMMCFSIPQLVNLLLYPMAEQLKFMYVHISIHILKWIPSVQFYLKGILWCMDAKYYIDKNIILHDNSSWLQHVLTSN